MTVQDDERERELVRLFNLKWDPAHQRAGVDAILPVTIDGTGHVLEVEVKSTTGSTDAMEAKIAIDFRLAEKSSRALTESDLADVCGAKAHYTLSDARSVLKRQWSVREYEQAVDMSIDRRPAYSPAAMLRILQRRALYIAQRGATLNNPHITKTHLARFFGTDREVTTDWAQSIRAVARDWLQARAR